MLYDSIERCKRIYGIIDEIKSYKTNKKGDLDALKVLNDKLSKGQITKAEHQNSLYKILKGKTQEELIREYNTKILNLLEGIKEENYQIYLVLGEEPKIEAPKAFIPAEVPEFLKLSKKELSKYLEDINVSNEAVMKFIKEQKKRQTLRTYQKVDYVVYKSNKYGKIANTFVEPITLHLTKKFPDLFKPLLDSLKIVNINMLSKSYISTIIFTSIISTLVFLVLFSIILKNVIQGLALGIVSGIITSIVIYSYPSSMIKTRRRKIKVELPFAIIHMAAVAGSGTQPLNIFTLLLESGEYPELSKEIKKIINYVNIFGYNLSTALKSVAATTPSPEFRELLNGIISTTETGGDLRNYLDGKSVDALGTYKLDRQKYVETIATYSDIYTGILVAAPLLFVTTLTIINVIGGSIAGLSVATIAAIGTFGLIPALNIGFIVFLNLTQQEI